MDSLQLCRRIDAARGKADCDLVLRGARWLDVFAGRWLTGDVAIDEGVIVGVGLSPKEPYRAKKTVNLRGRFLVPGFIDSHVHVESTLMTPDHFAQTVLPRGTTSAILDPHEIANVLGTSGIEYILKCAEHSPMDLYVMLSSCVPATKLETSGAQLTAADLIHFRSHKKVLGLAEMMNFPGLLNKDPEVLEKVSAFYDGLIDGHCPLLSGRDLNAYIACGVRSCHESVSAVEAQEKLSKGMLVQLREGSVAKNLADLVEVLTPMSSNRVSLATDDRNPVDIHDEGHLDFMIRLAIRQGANVAAVYRAASLTPALHYGLRHKGALAPGYDADIVILKDYKRCQVDRVLKAGRFVDQAFWQSQLSSDKILVAPPRHNTMDFIPPAAKDLQFGGGVAGANSRVRVIGVIPNQIITDDLTETLITGEDGLLHADLKQDICHIAVVERYGHGQAPALGFVKGLSLKAGALGSSVGHDSHNAVVTGTNASDMAVAFQRLKEMAGGFVVVRQGQILAELPLPIAGLMTDLPVREVSRRIGILRKAAKSLGCLLADPFLQMAFLCLPVIPSLKITDRGLIDVLKFEMVPVLLDHAAG